MKAILEDTLAERSDRKLVEIELPSIDPATGLLTKSGLMNATAKILAREGQNTGEYAAITVDLDNQGPATDVFESARITKEIACRLRSSVRSEDLVAHLNDNEFIIVMPSITSQVVVLKIAERILTAMSQPIVDGLVQIFPTLNIGISLSSDGRSPALEEVLHRSDLALQQAKAVCRGAVHFFDDSIAAQLDRRKEFEQDLRQVVANEELQLYYQPIYNVSSKMVSHFEALLRWQHPQLGLVSPTEFIPVAEAAGAIQSIGLWVLRQAVADLAVLDENGWGNAGITVNVSPEQLKHSKISEVIANVAAGHRGRIALEVTEDAVFDERYRMSAKLEALRQAGFKILLDDFGSGNASIGRLRSAKFDAIKIDRSLITNIDQNKTDLAIVQAILHLAENLKLDVIAEGVETRACFEILSAEKCQFVQGYYFSMPMPLQKLLSVIPQPDALDVSSQ